ncbi:MAG: hypothetical protein QM692_23680 [Thermomicrobiales bacterium]
MDLARKRRICRRFAVPEKRDGGRAFAMAMSRRGELAMRYPAV